MSLLPSRPPIHKRKSWSEDISLAVTHGITAHWELASLAAIQLLNSCAGMPPEYSSDLAGKTCIPPWDATPFALTRQYQDLPAKTRARVSRSVPGDWSNCEHLLTNAGYDGPLSTCSEESSVFEPDQRKLSAPEKRKPFNAGIINSSKKLIRTRWRRKQLAPEPESSGAQSTRSKRGAEDAESADTAASNLPLGSKGGNIKQSLDMASCPELGRPSQESGVHGEVRGPLGSQKQNCGGNSCHDQDRPNKLKPLSRHLPRSKSMSAATMTSKSYLLERRERRRKNRVSCEIFSDSICGPFRSPPPSEYGSSPHLIAIAGMRIAVEELDRLSIKANQYPTPSSPDQQPTPSTSGNSSKVVAPSNTPNTWSGISSVSPSVPSTPFVPPNSPMSSEDTPTYFIAQELPGKHSRGRRTVPSRLSEISNSTSMPEEPSIPEEPLDFESFPDFHDNDESSARQISPSPSVHSAATHYFSPANLSSSPASEIKLAGHSRCESPYSQHSEDSDPHLRSPQPVLPPSRHRCSILDALCVEGGEVPTSWRQIWKQGQTSTPTPVMKQYLTNQHAFDCHPDNRLDAQDEPEDFDLFGPSLLGTHEFGEGESPLGTRHDAADVRPRKENDGERTSVSTDHEGQNQRGSTLPSIPELERMGKVTER